MKENLKFRGLMAFFLEIIRSYYVNLIVFVKNAERKGNSTILFEKTACLNTRTIIFLNLKIKNVISKNINILKSKIHNLQLSTHIKNCS